MRCLPLVLMLACVEPPRPVARLVTYEAWAPPSWLHHADADVLASLPGLEAEGPRRGPVLDSRAVFVYDLDREQVLLARRPDEVRSLASLTKLFSALAAASAEPDLDAQVCITPEHWPTRPSGALSKFETGICYTGWDLLGAALVRSDNRGATGLHAVADLTFPQFLGRMEQVSAELGGGGEFFDPAGLQDENRATARDVARAVVAVAAHAELALAASAAAWRIATFDGERARSLDTTDPLAEVDRIEVLASKTGFTRPAGYCYAAVLRLPEGPRVAVVLLGASTSGRRREDLRRVLQWAGFAGDVTDSRPAPG